MMIELHDAIFRRRGAVSHVAACLGLSVAAVSQWKKRGIPERHAEKIQEALAQMDSPTGVEAA
jgi:predicted transcriptional regulator